jgi:hypothetical protein
MSHPLKDVVTPTRIKRAHGDEVGPKMLRAVWAAVTRYPGATCAELAVVAGYKKSSFGSVGMALQTLRAYGYIAFDDRAVGARRVLVPFVVTHLQRSQRGRHE